MIIKIFEANGSDAGSQIEAKISSWMQAQAQQAMHWQIASISTAATAVGEADDRYTHLIVTVVFAR